MGKRPFADPSHKPPSRRGGTNVPATGVRAEGMTDKCLDPPESLREPERIARNAVQQAFEAVFRPVVEFV